MATEESSQDILRLQFKAMQELQHRRLQKQMEKKKEKELSRQSPAEEPKESLEIADSLSFLHTDEQNLKSIFEQRVLEDEIQQLREELREAVDENGRLYKLLKERDFEIQHLKKKIEEDRLAFTGTAGVAGDVVATKIVELSKKNRVLMAESEGAKTRVKQLTSRIQELERELQEARARLPPKRASDAEARPLKAQTGDRTLLETPEVKALQERLTATNLKMSDLRNQIQSVKQELRMAQKVLASEVGEDFNIQQLLSSPGSWRGRAQQILVLQSKVRELEKQLGQTQSKEEPSDHADPKKLSAQEKHLLRIRSLEREKQESWEKLAGERDALQRELEELRKKLEAMKSRNKVLSNEVKTLKTQMGTLVEKGRHDDELIDALMEQLKQLQEILGSLSLQEEKMRLSQHNQDQKANSEAQRSSSLVAQLRAMVAEREEKVRQLELEIGQLSKQYLRSKGMGEGSARPDVSPGHIRVLEDLNYTKSPASSGDHASRLGSSRPVSSLGHTLVESALTRPSLPSPHGTSWGPSQPSPRFSDSPEHKGWQAQVAEIKALWQATEVERDRLQEFVTVLQKRVDESSSRLLEAERQLQEERQRTVVLEQRLEKKRLESGRASASQKASRSKAGAPASTTRHNQAGSERKDLSSAELSDVPAESQIEELTTRLAIQAEENEILRAALGSALRGKEEDFRMYHETLGQVKGVFIQALRQQKAERS